MHTMGYMAILTNDNGNVNGKFIFPMPMGYRSYTNKILINLSIDLSRKGFFGFLRDRHILYIAETPDQYTTCRYKCADRS